MWLGGKKIVINSLINKSHEQFMIHCNLCQTGSPYTHKITDMQFCFVWSNCTLLLDNTEIEPKCCYVNNTHKISTLIIHA